MSESHALHVDVFRAICALGWIDGRLDPDEAEAILRAAREEGLDAGSMAELESATRSPITFDDIDAERLSPVDRLYVYAVSSWIARLDGTTTDDERAALHAIATLIGVTGKGRAEMDATVAALAAEQSAPGRFDLRRLRDGIAARINRAG